MKDLYVARESGGRLWGLPNHGLPGREVIRGGQVKVDAGAKGSSREGQG